MKTRENFNKSPTIYKYKNLSALDSIENYYLNNLQLISKNWWNWKMNSLQIIQEIGGKNKKNERERSILKIHLEYYNIWIIWKSRIINDKIFSLKIYFSQDIKIRNIFNLKIFNRKSDPQNNHIMNQSMSSKQ